MKILHLSHSCGRGGAETLLLDLCRQGQKEGHQMYLMTDLGGELEGDFAILLQEHFFKRKRSPLRLIGYLLWLRTFLVKESIAVVHTHTAGDALYAWFACLGLSIGKVDTHHGFRLNGRLLSRWCSRFMLPRMNWNVFVSKYQEEVYKKKCGFAYSSTVIYNGIDLAKIQRNRTGKLRAELDVGETILLGMVGNFGNSVRDHFTVCEALCLLTKQTVVPFRFVFVGAKNKENPEIFDRCFNYCEQNGLKDVVHFLGGRGDVGEILADLDLFVYSTNEDTFGIGVVEAQLAGLSVVANDHPVMKEVLDPQRTVFYPTKDKQALSKVLSGLLASGVRRVAAKDEVRRKYSVATCFANYLALYQKMALSCL